MSQTEPIPSSQFPVPIDQILYPFASNFELEFESHKITQIHRDFWWIPLLVVPIYLYGVVYQGQKFMKTRKLPLFITKSIPYILFIWNALLSAFSIAGFFRVFPFFAFVFITSLLGISSIKASAPSGSYLFCSPGMATYGSGPVGLWVVLFMWSKYIELLDTVLLVVRKKPVTFLHYFHHATVLLYCWYAGAAEQSTGIFFAVMNYGVHALMYLYYTLQALVGVGLLRARPSWGKLVTILQLLQMALGVTVTLIHSWLINHRDDCDGNPVIIAAAFAMYSVYGALFLKFFYTRYTDKQKYLYHFFSSLRI